MAGDVSPEEFRRALHRAADMAADYLEGVGEYPVLPPVAPGEVSAGLSVDPPAEGEPLDRILDDYKTLIEPNVTHWNHPGFMAYFGITGSRPGVIAETLSAALNVNAMLWRSSPAATELEERVCDWLRRMMDLPEVFRGHINDTAAICPELRETLRGLDLGDSLVVNPHKWLFVPIDCSVLYVRDSENLKGAFSLVPDYLATPDEGVTNLMDLGVQLGRRRSRAGSAQRRDPRRGQRGGAGLSLPHPSREPVYDPRGDRQPQDHRRGGRSSLGSAARRRGEAPRPSRSRLGRDR